MLDTLPRNRTGLHTTVMPSFITDRNSTFNYACKRIFDVSVAAVLLVLLSPIMLVLALIVKLDSPGSSIFVQERVGARPRFRNGRVEWEVRNFKFFKFRSMAQNADQSLHQAHIKAFATGKIQASDKDEAKFKLANDPRVTRIGGILRKTSLDELPQLFNVLRGEMSLVGPRPVPVYEVAEYRPWHFERLEAMPGITGLWQVEGRSKVSFDEMIRLDIKYVRKQSLWYDFRILLMTVWVVFTGFGAR